MIIDDLKVKMIKQPSWVNKYKEKLTTADEAVNVINSGDSIVVQPGCAVPRELLRAMVKRKDELFGVKLYHILIVGDIPYLKPGMEEHFRHRAFFIGANSRKAINEGRADYIPIYLSEVTLLFKNDIIPVDISLINVSPPDEHGFCSYGIDVGNIKTPTDKAKIVIAQVNPQMPRGLGNSFIHVNKIDHIVEHDEPLLELPQVDPNASQELIDIYDNIGKNVAELIDDGATLQMGIGAIPDNVMKYLRNKNDLGVHTEMFSDGMIELVDEGIITGDKKTLHQGKIIAGFVLGTKKAYDYIDDNPIFEFHPQEYVNDPFVIAKNKKMVAINSALEVDLTGQVCADSIGTKLFSGFGGQVDFIRGAAYSEGGKPIIALPSTTKDGKISRIVPTLKPGAGVVTSRGDVHYVVTEYGIAQLWGKSIKERTVELIRIAHPKFRGELTEFAKETYNIIP